MSHLPIPLDEKHYPRHPVGPSYALQLPTMDFECYSEAGYVYEARGRYLKSIDTWLAKWVKLGPKGGISAVGGWAYAAHPSTEVITLNYDLLDGLGVQRWNPTQPPPVTLLTYLSNGGLIEAHNAQFEFAVWKYVCVRKYGWPKLNILQFRDSAAKASAWALPRALENAGKALNLQTLKDMALSAKAKKLWIPRAQTKDDRRLRLTRFDEPALHELNDVYCDRDVQAEMALSHAVPELGPFEQQVYQHDLQVAERGIYIDQEAVSNAIEVFKQAEAKYEPELVRLTGGAVKTANSHSALKKWLHAQGVYIPDTQADTVDEWVEKTEIADIPKRVLVIRQMLGSASVKKLFAMDRCRMSDGRARGALKFCGASTGRWSGSLFQPHNFPNSGPDMLRCSCGSSYCSAVACCPTCGQPPTGKPDEWSYEDMLYALIVFKSRSLEEVERWYGNASKAIAGTLRGMLCAAPGKEFLCSDYSAIEARVIAELAGEQWRIRAFKEGKDIYLESAGQMLNTPYGEYEAYKKSHGSHHPDRKKGKVGELACLGPQTQVLTHRGYVKITEILLSDRLWDGEQWVQHAGLVKKGRQRVINLDGVQVTPDHLILSNSWKEARLLDSNPSILKQSLEIGSESLPSCVQLEALGNWGLSSTVPVELGAISYPALTYTSEKQHDAETVPGAKQERHGINTILNTSNTARTRSTVNGLLTDCVLPFRDATWRQTQVIVTTGLEVYTFAKNGGKNSEPGHFLSMLQPLKGGTTQNSRWIGSTPTTDIARGISASFLVPRTCSTSGQYLKCKLGSTNWSDVYDIAHVGVRNRFTIKTNSGHLIVHNCGYGGGVNALAQFGADKFMTPEEMAETIKKWRKASPAICKLWYGLEDAAVSAVIASLTHDQRNALWLKAQSAAEQNRLLLDSALTDEESKSFWRAARDAESIMERLSATQHPAYAYNRIIYGVKDEVLYCRLPSGRYLAYHQPRVELEEKPWGGIGLSLYFMGTKEGANAFKECSTWGGTLAENVTQAVARDILAYAMVNLDKAGYPIVLHVHDEVIAEVDAGFGSVEEFERIMAEVPPWAEGWTISAAGGWRRLRYGKD